MPRSIRVKNNKKTIVKYKMCNDPQKLAQNLMIRRSVQCSTIVFFYDLIFTLSSTNPRISTLQDYMYPSRASTIGTTITNIIVLSVTTLVENSTSPSP